MSKVVKLFIGMLILIIEILLIVFYFNYGKLKQLEKSQKIINLQTEIINQADSVFCNAYIIEYKDSNYTVEQYMNKKINLQNQLYKK